MLELKNDWISSGATISNNSNSDIFRLHDGTYILCFLGAGGHVMISGILCSDDVGV
ncbi:hypothetical protein HanXRQr2_Chr15g0705441 [Helianthus annuus]|nr:hypothetical protein HanXRQr2_Chr15g0705441 [Helianthus annuus]KAJ0832288.1 hypothetical protein HanPSC8_Chr15g0677071 [Helianthus annuus]